MGGLTHQETVLVCIFGAGFGVLIGYAMFRFRQPKKDEIKDIGSEQAVYMREVRLRNKGMNHFEAMETGRAGRGKQNYAPTDSSEY